MVNDKFCTTFSCTSTYISWKRYESSNRLDTEWKKKEEKGKSPKAFPTYCIWIFLFGTLQVKKNSYSKSEWYVVSAEFFHQITVNSSSSHLTTPVKFGHFSVIDALPGTIYIYRYCDDTFLRFSRIQVPIAFDRYIPTVWQLLLVDR